MKKKIEVMVIILIVFCLFIKCTSSIKSSNFILLAKPEINKSETQEKIYDYDEVKDIVLRFHVLANSDSEEDQNLKLKVRDKILDYLKPYLQDANSREEARKLIIDKENEIKKLSLKIIKENGYDYDVRTEVASDNFPEKAYGNIILPQGSYQAFRVIIGNGDGHNWWCVMFPALCFIDITKGQVEEAESREKLDEAVEAEKTENVKVKFKLVEIIKKFFK